MKHLCDKFQEIEQMLSNPLSGIGWQRKIKPTINADEVNFWKQFKQCHFISGVINAVFKEQTLAWTLLKNGLENVSHPEMSGGEPLTFDQLF